jgi:hypothetical protein
VLSGGKLAKKAKRTSENYCQMAENNDGRQPATGIGLRLLDRGTQTHGSDGRSDGWGLTYENGFIVRVAV